ncbi:MAG: hypothetical protein K6A40_06975 [Solobacterium sp.]|nr:hypothetical protein [Solobacterium sp.]
MNLDKYDGKCVRIITVSGEVFEGLASYDSEEYAFHEYGRNQEALHITPILFFKSEILRVISLEDVNGPFGHYSEKYGLLEKKCLEWGTDLIEEVLDSEDNIQILRMLACMKDHFRPFLDRGVPGLAPWRKGISIMESEDDENGLGPVYLGELENMLGSLVKYNDNKEVVNEAKRLLDQLAEYYSCK